MNAPLRIGVAGLGNVGTSLVRMLERHGNDLAVRTGHPLSISGVSARSRNKDRGVDLSGFTWFDDPAELARDPGNDLFVELIGGAEGAALDCVRTAIDAGKHVVTANKALLAEHGLELARAAEHRGVSLNFEAAAAGGIPIIKTLRESLAGNTVHRVYGILNGTCNYILTRMEQDGLSFADCLKALTDAGASVERALAVGGGSRSRKWLRIIANALNITIDVPEEGDFGAGLGAARLGLIVAENADPFAVCTQPAIRETIAPDPNLVPAYAEAYATYRKLYPAIKEAMPR